jgi:PIN domain nuclease of toxin-antitoxin system
VTDRFSAVVLDASALLAYLRGETGSDIVEAALSFGTVISSANYAEVLSRLVDIGEEPEEVDRGLRERGLIGGLVTVVPLSEADGVTIAQLRPLTRAQGLSLGDRACLATGLRLGRPVMTADRGWEGVDIGVPVRLIRP